MLPFLSHLTSQQQEQLWEELAALYEELEQEMAQMPQPCTMCARCCHFTQEYRLYASSLELLYVLDKYRSALRPLQGACPFLENRRCTVRDRRMLGCRTYFRLHDNKSRAQAEDLYERKLRKLQKLHEKYQIEWQYQDCMGVFEELFAKEPMAILASKK